MHQRFGKLKNIKRTVCVRDLGNLKLSNVQCALEIWENLKCVPDSDYRSEVIIFEPILTTFESSVVFGAAGAEVKIGSNLKSIHLKQI